jgi:midasin (ATPase involved in ribosome maturation)
MGRLGTISRDLFGKKSEIPYIPKSVVHNKYAKRYLEKIAENLYFAEPSLLVGDTGCGKTTLV